MSSIVGSNIHFDINWNTIYKITTAFYFTKPSKMKRPFLSGLVFLVLVASSCVSTRHKIVDERRNPDWKGGKVNNLLIIGVYNDHSFRVSAERVLGYFRE